MYSLIRVWIGLKLARMLIQVRVVVSTTSRTESPSAPILYWMPKIGIQSDGLDELERRVRGVVGDQQDQRDDPRRDREHEGDRSGQTGRQDRDGDRAEQRQERDERQDREGPEVDGHRATSHRYDADHDDEPDGDARGRSSGRGPVWMRRRPRPEAMVSRPTALTVPSTISRSNHHRAPAILPPMTMNRRWLSSSNHHLLSDARYRNGTRALSAWTRSGRAPASGSDRSARRTAARPR